MNPKKDFPKIPVRDLTDYLIINRYGVFNTNGIYVVEEISLKRFPKPNKKQIKKKHATHHHPHRDTI